MAASPAPHPTGRPPISRWQLAAVLVLFAAAFATQALVPNVAFRLALADPAHDNLLPAALTAIARDAARFPLVQARIAIASPAAWWPLALVSMAFVAVCLIDRRRGDRRSPPVIETAIAVGVCAGVLVWFLRGADVDWTQRDWPKEWTYFTAWQEAIRADQLPWILRSQFQGTDHLLANLETMVAPQLVLLLWLSVPTFVMVNLLGYAMAGTVGLYRTSREHGIDSAARFALLLLFVMNGHITSHLAAGHLQWAAYFLLPLVFLFLTRVANGTGDTVANGAGLSLTFAAMLMPGGWHVFVWAWLFTLTFGAMSRSRWRFMAVTCALTAGTTAFRVLPGVTAFGGGTNTFMGGFADLPAFVNALVGAAGWEEDTFLGWTGFVIACLGLTSVFRSTHHSTRALWLPSLVLVVLSFHDLYGRTLFHLPGFVSERVTSRLAIVGVLGWLFLGFQQVSEWRPRSHSSLRQAVVMVAGLILVTQLVLHAQAVRPTASAGQDPAVAAALKPMAPDATYRYSVMAGWLISAAAAAYAIRCMTRREGVLQPARSS